MSPSGPFHDAWTQMLQFLEEGVSQQHQLNELWMETPWAATREKKDVFREMFTHTILCPFIV